MTLRLHHCPQSRSMRVLWLLNELGVPFDLVTHPFDKSLRRPDFLALSPAGRVPALEIDGTVLFESGAIVEFLCERFSPEALGRPSGHSERVDWLIWVHFAETLSQHIAALTQQHVMIYEDAMRSPIVMKLEAARIGKCLAALEERFTKRGPFLLAGGFSAADICVGQAVYMARYFHALEAFTAVGAWWHEISARPGFKASLPAPGTEIYAQTFYAPWEAS